MPSIRLDRYLSGQGLGTRKEVRDILRRGLVTVNGEIRENPESKVSAGSDCIRVSGKEIQYEEHVYYMMNKPRGLVSASRDPKEKTVLDLLPDNMRRPGLFPAGRLDKDTEGLLIITDDGDFSHRILSPKKHVNKRYLVKTDLPLEESMIADFEKGLVLEDGFVCLPAKLEIAGSCEAVVTIHEGKYHQVKRMFSAKGRTVTYLKRISMGGLSLGRELGAGQSRRLTPREIRSLSREDS